MRELAGFLLSPIYVASCLLVLAGTGKIRRPLSLSVSLARAGLGGSFSLVRAIGFLELLGGIAALAWTNAITVAFVGLAYVAFAGYLAWLLWSHVEGASCGCSTVEMPPTAAHVAADLILATTCGMAVYATPPSVFSAGRVLGLSSPILVLGLVASLALTQAALRYLPELLGAPHHRAGRESGLELFPSFRMYAP